MKTDNAIYLILFLRLECDLNSVLNYLQHYHLPLKMTSSSQKEKYGVQYIKLLKKAHINVNAAI